MQPSSHSATLPDRIPTLSAQPNTPIPAHTCLRVPGRAEKSCVSSVFCDESCATSFVARRPTSSPALDNRTNKSPKPPIYAVSKALVASIHFTDIFVIQKPQANGLWQQSFKLISSSGSPAGPSLPLYSSPGLYCTGKTAALSRFWLAVRAVAYLGVPGHHKWVPLGRKKLHGEDRDV